MRSSSKFIGTPLLALLNLAVMVSLRNLPLVAKYGFLSAFYYLLVALLFLLPVTFVSAELASMWKKSGGIYVWVKEAFGEKWGFFAIWLQWVHSIPWYPVILSFVAATLAYLINPALANNGIYILVCILSLFWGFTLLNCFGIKHSSWISVSGVFLGTLVPGLLLICLGITWIWQGHPIQIQFSLDQLLPKTFELNQLVLITSLFLAFGGLEVSAAYIHHVIHPQKNYPKAILFAALVALVLYVLGALSLAIILPEKEISLVQGLIEGFHLLLDDFGLQTLFIPLSLLILFGALGELNAWLIGPIQALHATAMHGDLPPLFRQLNRRGAPVPLLLFQAVIVSLVSFAFLLMPDPSAAFWILSVIAIQLYLGMYLLMFFAAIKLRYRNPELERPFQIPLGTFGLWFFCILGIASSLFALLLGFIPPSQITVGSNYIYETFLITTLLVMCLIPYTIFKIFHPRMK